MSLKTYSTFESQHDRALDTCDFDPSMTLSTSRQWPGERHPTRWDVHDANESPAATFLDQFRAALLHSEGAEHDVLLDDDPEIGASQQADSHDVFKYTYPMVLLSEVPPTPTDQELAHFQTLFSTTFKKHFFLDFMDNVPTSSSPTPPYLDFASACLGSITSSPTASHSSAASNDSSRQDVSAALFIAGVNLWSVMLEVDNREARQLEAVIAASLLSTYGLLSADKVHWRKASGILSNVVTISRRLHLTDGHSPLYHASNVADKDFMMKSSLISYMILVDTLHAAYFGLAPNLSTSELFIRMPWSNHQFRTVYNCLVHGHETPSDMRRPEDALLLLTAILNDTIHVNCSFLSLQFPDVTSGQNINGHIQESINPSPNRHVLTSNKKLRNPWAPLTAGSEFCRLRVDLLAALSRWEDHFQDHIGSDILALGYFTRLQLHCPEMWELPYVAGYGRTAATTRGPTRPATKIEVPDKAMDLSWQVLYHCDKASKSSIGAMAIWLPIVVFLSALVVWQKLRSQRPGDIRYGTLKVLTMFQNELAKLPWACCSEMIKLLDRLMNQEQSADARDDQ
ncbi:hypothetical protein PV10_03678 [Exophiala mesophila]|uniref:Xylanolytic transcriptional activator regulatory domain-containing protein n=1 Tax=Exophiala mesophila TaxID=212818 RepID=A0A0D1ZZY9_EXOME|nr:uncharacterized protein PV10_03678 [Exophiala mesophila]KIV92373.1 hypothetical protein PV10_03678 [Exophiala mesophila]